MTQKMTAYFYVYILNVFLKFVDLALYSLNENNYKK